MTEQAISACAAELRENLGISPTDAIGDIQQAVAMGGYEYREEPFEEAYSGFSALIEGNQYVIGFNAKHRWSETYRRFMVAHELGHVNLPEHRRMLEGGQMHRSRPEFQVFDGIEREADYFAISFLAPRKAFQAAMQYKEGTSETIHALATAFGISPYSAALRFVELTDLSCTLVVSRSDGMISHERRSDRMKETYKQAFLAKQRVKGTTYTHEVIQGNRGDESCAVMMCEWYDDLPEGTDDLEATESVISLGYNGTYLTLLVPTAPDLDEYLESI